MDIDADVAGANAAKLNWDGDICWLAESAKSNAEATVAKRVRLMSAFGSVGATIPDGLSDHQQEAARIVMSRELSILGGGPGTGKTFTAAKIIGLAIEKYGQDNVAVGCPTGKAAVRITASLSDSGIHLAARTWHSLLKVSQLTEIGGWQFEHNEENPFPYRFLVGDESSMLDTNLTCCIFRAIPTGCPIIFVGDVQQLPPVGHGAPLRDMIESGEVAYAELKEIHRNSGHIVRVCTDMRNNTPWSGVKKIDIEAGDNLKVLEADSPDDQIEKMIESLRAIGSSTKTDIGGKKKQRFDAVWDCQVIVPVNKKSPLARTKLNQVLQAEFNGNPSIPGNPFRLHDKVVNTRNSHLDLVDEYGEKIRGNGGSMPNDNNEPHRAYVANGEIGRVSKVEPKRITIELESPTRRIIVPRGHRGQQNDSDDVDDSKPNTGCNWDLAYAISAHKSQGSEWPVAIVMLDEYPGAMRLCDRAWLYTAVSRAKKLCLMIGKKSVADAMCRRTNIDSRKTFLKELIQQ